MKLHFGVKDEAFKAVKEYIPMSMSDILKQFNSSHIELTAVKNQSAAFQVILLGDDDFSLSVTDSTYFDKQGLVHNVRLKVVLNEGNGIISSRMNIVGFIEDDNRVPKADILLSQEAIFVNNKEPQPVWVEFDIPDTLDAGKYGGRVEIYRHIGFEKEVKAGEISFNINVKNVVLPCPDKYSFYLDLWQHNSNIARKHEVLLWSEEHFRIIDGYVKSLAKLGQKAVSVIASEIPWSGQFCYRDTQYKSNFFEYSMISVEKDISGNLNVNFNVVDQYIDLCFRYGINSEIEVFGLLNIWMCEEEGFGKVINGFSDGIRVRYLDKSDNCFKYIDTIDDIVIYIKEIERYFRQKGIIEKVRIVADEPSNVNEFNERMGFLRRIAPAFKYKTATNHLEFIKKFNNEIDDFIPYFETICESPDRIKEMKRGLKGKLCWYVACRPEIPNTFLKSNLLESYTIGWLTAYMQLDGFLRWNYTVWPENPRERISFRAPFWPAGDTLFVYPSNNGTPLLSLRYKALLKGIQTFELINKLKEKNPNADDILNEAYKKIFKFKAFNEFHPDERKKAGELISLEYQDYMEALNIVIEGLA